ncbi:SDR family oxidoreductase [Flagellimonas flava]|uniref:dTDP-4-dehydrorhamnose reductase n=1 Tax=Flagellimonas flava TaxID=570519 RepID=A0A1M5L2M0_9FLAO|nr:NAD(P)-dependent oxidoreductase [Allomuricauda flava]SHG59009.1 dTDP-4-dehydrorhamnose reductase [Allomuricauda flava]
MSFKITDNTKVYIAGCGGMLGESVYQTFTDTKCTVKATDINLTAPWLSYADVSDYSEISKDIKSFAPDLIINLAALTDLEYCEKNQEQTWLYNALGPENIGLIANELDVPVVYISTAGIVDGKQDVYNDFDEVNPLSIYAKAKYHGEVFTQNHVRKFFVFRAGWMMGGGPGKDKKFVNKIYKQLKSGQKELFVVDDKLGTPTYTKSFAKGILEVVQSGLYGVYNQVCNGDCSRFDVAKEFVRLLGLEKDVKVTKVDSDYFKAEYFAPRPFSEKLVNLKLNARGLNVMPDWQEALEDYSKVFIEDLA